jgi:hypothetical protein
MRSLHFAIGGAPVETARQGAAAYNAQAGLPHDPGHDYGHAIVAPSIVAHVARAYNALPEHDNSALPAFHAMREEVKRQFEHLTTPTHRGGMGFEVNVAHKDPYGNGADDLGVHEMFHDVANRRMSVLATAATGGHPVFSNDENDMFRAVHDVFGHAGTGRGVDRHGEEAAFRKHARMFSPLARQALATETRGQNHAMIQAGGEFQQQKVALLPEPLTRVGFTNLGGAAERAKAVLQAQQFHKNMGL